MVAVSCMSTHDEQVSCIELDSQRQSGPRRRANQEDTTQTHLEREDRVRLIRFSII